MLCLYSLNRVQEQHRGLLSTVTAISLDSSERSQEKLRFVAADIIEQDLEGKTPQEIYNLVFNEYDSQVPANENSPTFAATIFREMIQCANFDNSQVQDLNRFCKEGLEDESWREKLSFRRRLLDFGDAIPDDNKALKKLVRKIPKKQIRGHRDNIKTPIQLFQSLLNRGTISFKKASESLEALEDYWKEVDGE